MTDQFAVTAAILVDLGVDVDPSIDLNTLFGVVYVDNGVYECTRSGGVLVRNHYFQFQNHQDPADFINVPVCYFDEGDLPSPILALANLG